MSEENKSIESGRTSGQAAISTYNTLSRELHTKRLDNFFLGQIGNCIYIVLFCFFLRLCLRVFCGVYSQTVPLPLLLRATARNHHEYLRSIDIPSQCYCSSTSIYLSYMSINLSLILDRLVTAAKSLHRSQLSGSLAEKILCSLPSQRSFSSFYALCIPISCDYMFIATTQVPSSQLAWLQCTCPSTIPHYLHTQNECKDIHKSATGVRAFPDSSPLGFSFYSLQRFGGRVNEAPRDAAVPI